MKMIESRICSGISFDEEKEGLIHIVRFPVENHALMLIETKDGIGIYHFPGKKGEHFVKKMTENQINLFNIKLLYSFSKKPIITTSDKINTLWQKIESGKVLKFSSLPMCFCFFKRDNCITAIEHYLKQANIKIEKDLISRLISPGLNNIPSYQLLTRYGNTNNINIISFGNIVDYSFKTSLLSYGFLIACTISLIAFLIKFNSSEDNTSKEKCMLLLLLVVEFVAFAFVASIICIQNLYSSSQNFGVKYVTRELEKNSPLSKWKTKKEPIPIVVDSVENRREEKEEEDNNKKIKYS